MDPDRARELLAGERSRIERALAELEPEGERSLAEENEPGDRDSEDLYEHEFNTGLAEGLAQQLAALERAEQRLREGTYGLSVDSGVPIPDERLEAIPTAERTVEEQQRRG